MTDLIMKKSFRPLMKRRMEERGNLHSSIVTLNYQARDSRFRGVIVLSVIQWWRLMLNPAKHYELPSMELSWAWEPAYKEGA